MEPGALTGPMAIKARAPALWLAAALAVCPFASGCGDRPRGPRLLGRAVLGVRASAPAPFPAVEDADPRPAPRSTQPVGGFSALLDAPGRDTFLAMVDNGFATKANSRSFLLRVYRVHLRFETGDGGAGEVEVRDPVELRDPDRKVPFPIVNERTETRLLTGADFDPESLQRDVDGTLWFGDEFGPFLLHTDAAGKVLEAPVPLPGVRTPDTPPAIPRPRRHGDHGSLARLRGDGDLPERPPPLPGARGTARGR